MPYYAGIDMAARSSHICIINQRQEVLLDEKVPNDLDVISEKLFRYRRGLSVVVEASFNWYWIVDYLQGEGIPTKLAHPVMLKAITSAKVKTDRRDALWLARLLRGDLIPESHICPIEQRRLRDLCRFRFRLMQRHGTSLKQLRQVIGNEGYHTVSRSVLRHLDVDSLDTHDIVQDVCRFHQTDQAHLTETIAEIDDLIISKSKRLPVLSASIERVRSITGFGPVNATTVVLESGDVSRFPNHKPYCSYARLAPGIAQSGETTRQGRANKAGNEHLKRAYTSAAVVASQHSDRILAFKERHLERRSSNKAKAIIVNNIIAHKLATGVFYTLSTGENYKEQKLFPSR